MVFLTQINDLFNSVKRFPESEWGGGINMQAKNNGYIYLENVTSSHADQCGLQLYRGTADYHIGEVSCNTVGARVSTVGFDIRRLQDRVLYHANGMNLDMETLKLPFRKHRGVIYLMSVS